MFVSQRRIDANRRNAALSTGPKTPEGKARSRANGLVHGLCCTAIAPDGPGVVAERAAKLFDTLKPQNHFHCWIVTEIARITLQIERSGRIDVRTRDKIAIKAELSWDDDRRLEAELLGEQLASRPAVVVEQLRRTPQGCEWMMERWAMLAYAADRNDGRWTPAQERLAFDLLATPADFREGHEPGVALDFLGRPVDDVTGPAAVARREVGALVERLGAIRGLDEANRALAMADLYDHDPELKRARRYEGTLHSRLRWCLRQLQQKAPPRDVPSWLRQDWLGYLEETKAKQPPPAPLPEPVAVPEPPPEWAGKKARVDAIHAPFELEPHEIPPLGQRPDYERILASRRSEKKRAAEADREADRQKAKKLIA